MGDAIQRWLFAISPLQDGLLFCFVVKYQPKEPSLDLYNFSCCDPVGVPRNHQIDLPQCVCVYVCVCVCVCVWGGGGGMCVYVCACVCGGVGVIIYYLPNQPSS